tara:strand:+ start:3758 stop:4066 length:309 start_codon:yes stop_codon:yes gene_type:complete
MIDLVSPIKREIHMLSYNNCNTSIGIVDSDMAKRGVGQPKKEPTSVRSIRLPDRVWKLVSKESKNHRSVNRYILSLIEDSLIDNDKLKDSKRISHNSNSTKG